MSKENFSPIWALQQGGSHLEVKRTLAGSGDNIDDQNFILQFREIYLLVNNEQENEDDICYSLLHCREVITRNGSN